MRESCRGGRVGRSSLRSAGDTPATTAAFTLIELIVVIAIIIVLAGLILSTVGYVQKKGARARAETEIAAISAACESYKADNGVYPTDSGTTETLRPNVDPGGGDPASASFLSSGRFLYPKISGDTDGNPSNSIEGKGYFAGALKSNMLSPNPAGPNTYIRDPFGNAYGYSTFESVNPGSADGNNPTFDIWTTCGETAKKSTETFQQYQQRWIKNW
jgi:type II secretory pathway pseudopilin PulG